MKGSTGDLGAQGAKGDKGDSGALGAPGPGGAGGYQVVVDVAGAVTLAPGQQGGVQTGCPAGKVAIGGGVSTALAFVESWSRPLGGNSWLVGGRNVDNHSGTFTPYAICANAS